MTEIMPAAATMTAKELGAYLHKSVPTVHRWSKLGYLPPGRKYPDGYRWVRREVDAWMENVDKTPKDIEKARSLLLRPA